MVHVDGQGGQRPQSLEVREMHLARGLLRRDDGDGLPICHRSRTYRVTTGESTGTRERKGGAQAF